MGRFINPFTDYGFKKIFGQEISKDLLIDFLNDLLKGERVITDLTFLNNEQLPEWEDARALIYDIHCTTDTGEKIIVEMQNKSQAYFRERALFYLSHAVTRQGQRGDWMFDIKAVYGVFFMNFCSRIMLSYAPTSFLPTVKQASYSATRCAPFLSLCRCLIKKKRNVKMILNVGFMC